LGYIYLSKSFVSLSEVEGAASVLSHFDFAQCDNTGRSFSRLKLHQDDAKFKSTFTKSNIMNNKQLLTQIFCALAATASIAFAANAAPSEMQNPRLTLPLMSKSPVIDGAINADEWAGADQMQGFTPYKTKGLAPQQASFWVGADNENLYLAVRSETPPGGKILKRANPIKSGASTSAVAADDRIEIRIVPEPEAADRKLFMGLVNAKDAIAYSVSSQRGGIKWDGKWKVSNSIQDDFWDSEIAIPWKELDVANPAGKTMAIRIGRGWRQTASGKIETDWGLGQTAFDDVASMPRVTWQANAPVVQLQQLQDAPNQQINMHLAVSNPTNTNLQLNITSRTTPDGSAESTFTKNITLTPGQNQLFEISGPGSANEYLKTHLQVASPDGNSIYYLRDFEWRIDRPKEIWNLNPEAAKRTAVQFAYYPSFNKMHVKVDISNLPNREQVKDIALVVRKKGSSQNIATININVDKAGVAEIWDWDLPELNGDYELLATPQGIKSDPVVSPFQRQHFEWENNTYGTSDIVVPPFTPIKAQGNNIDVILRHIQTNGVGLWNQVTALDKPLLKSPMRLEATIDGKVLLAKGQSKVLSHKDTQAITEANWQAGTLQGSTRNEWDYDGVVKSTFTLQPTGQPVQDLTLIIPLDNKAMPLMHAATFGGHHNYAGHTPSGEGVIWKSSQAPSNKFIGNYVPYIWLGDPERGLAVFGENDAGWITDDEIDAQEIVRRKDGTLELRLHLIQKSATWDKPRQITIGLQATPAKPMPDNWRLWMVSTSRTSTSQSKLNVPGMMKQAFVASTGYWGGIANSGDIFPDDGNLGLWEEFKRLRQTGKADSTFLQKWSDIAYSKLSPESRKSKEIHAVAGLRGMVTQPQNVMIYTNPRGLRADVPDSQTYINEWSRDAFPQHQWDYAKGFDYGVDPSKSFRDNRAWWYHQSMSIFNDAIYWDCVFLQPNYNPATSAAYVREDGQVQPSSGLWNMRAMVKRGAVLAQEMGKQNTNEVHMSGTNIVPVNDFAATQADWELKWGEGDFQDKFPRDFIQAQSIGRQAGLVPIVILTPSFIVGNKEEKAWQYRTAAGVSLTHEVKPWSSNGSYEKPDSFWENYDKLVEFGYGQSSTKVYNYWESTFPATISGETSSLIVSKPGSIMLVVCDYGDGGEHVINLDTKVLSLNGQLKAVNVETGSAIPVTGNTLKINLKKHDFMVLRIDAP